MLKSVHKNPYVQYKLTNNKDICIIVIIIKINIMIIAVPILLLLLYPLPFFPAGGVTVLEEARKIHEETGVAGVMVAQGLLNNPALFAGYEASLPHSQFELQCF